MQKLTVVMSVLAALCAAPFYQARAGAAEATAETANISAPLVIWSRNAAKSWKQNAYPIGNGRLGAMIFGHIHSDDIQFNESSLWKGGPGASKAYNGGNPTGGAAHIKAVQEAILHHHVPMQILNRYFRGSPQAYGCYQAFGDITVKSRYPSGDVSHYRRTLNLDNSLAQVRFQLGGITFRRTYFCSYPDQVFVGRYTASTAHALNLTIGLTSPHKHCTVQATGNKLLLTGHISDNHMGFQAVLLVRTHGGKITDVKNNLHVEAATSVTLILSAATAYLDRFPTYTGNHYRTFNRHVMADASSKSYDTLLKNHEKDYRSLFDRVSLQLASPAGKLAHMTTRRELKAYFRGAKDPHLQELIFQYGRYLLISSSRAGGLPANLQGIWNDSDRPAWTCDFHTDINLEMNYWPAETTNLSPCVAPLVSFIRELQKPGHITAETVYGAGGWTCHCIVNAFGYTGPGWALGWGLFPAAGAWICQPIWEHYAYTHDTNYLKQQAYPILKGAADFWVDHLILDPHGHYVSSPAISPEWGPITEGTACDQELIWNLFTHCIAASRILHVDKSFRDKLIVMLHKLAPLRIGKAGQLQEWRADLDKPSAFRHLSPLIGLYPGSEISPLTTPRYAAAAKLLLSWRGRGTTGWSWVWRSCCWAALLNGNKAQQMLRGAIMWAFRPNLLNNCGQGFQIDGNFGATAAITAMLLQTRTGVIQFLPALPSDWSVGRVDGLVAKGDVIVGESWGHGALPRATLSPHDNAAVQLAPPPGMTIKSIRTQSGKACVWSKSSADIVTVKLAANKTYEVTFAAAAH